MTDFILVSALITGLGVIPFIGLLIRRPSVDKVDRRQLNLALHEEHLAIFRGEPLSPELSTCLEEESERQLLTELELEPTPPPPELTGGHGRKTILIVLFLLPLLAGSSYLLVGRPDLLDHSPLETARRDQEVIRQLAERLKTTPDDLQGWVLLGRSLLTTQRPKEAAKAFETATRLSKNNPDIAVLWAEAQAEAQEGRLEGQPAETIQHILKEHPRHRMALWLGGLAAAQAGQVEEARGLWRQLRGDLPDGSPEQQELDGYLGQLGPEPSTKSAQGASVRVRVQLDPRFKTEVQAEEAVFIFARSPEGPPMPLAVIRKQVRDLPIEVVLDDRLAMRPGLELSGQPRVVIGARISRNGQPVAQSGDLEGFTPPVKPGDPALQAVTINQRHP